MKAKKMPFFRVKKKQGALKQEFLFNYSPLRTSATPPLEAFLHDFSSIFTKF